MPAETERAMSKFDPRKDEQKVKKGQGPKGLKHQNAPKKTSTDNPERNPRDQKGRGGSK
jgi:hypothetical protein